MELLDPRLNPGGITQAASNMSGPVAPGEILSLRGIHIGPVDPLSMQLDNGGLVSRELGGIRVLFDGIAAPLLYVSAGQVNLIVPYEAVAKSSLEVRVESHGQTSAPVTLAVAESNPALFTLDSSGRGLGAILNHDGSLNSTANPAPRGTLITLFATGEGQTHPPGVNGKLGDAPLPVPVLPVQLFIAAAKADMHSAGGASGQVAGLLTIVARVPESAAPGLQPLVLQVGNASSPSGVFLAVA